MLSSNCGLEKVCEHVDPIVNDLDLVELGGGNWGLTAATAQPTAVVIVEDKTELHWDETKKVMIS